MMDSAASSQSMINRRLQARWTGNDMKTSLIVLAVFGLAACHGKIIDLREEVAGKSGASPDETGGSTAGSSGSTASEGGAGQGSTPQSGGNAGSGPAEGGAAGASEGGAAGSPEGGSAGTPEAGAAGTPEGGAAGMPEGGAAGSPEDILAACMASSNLPTVVGTWTGESESFGTVTVVIDGASELGGVCGTVALGTDVAPPAPTDPEVGWPPSYREVADTGLGGIPSRYHAPGYPYAIISGGVASTRALFTIDQNAAWTDWCELQTPVEDADGSFACLPNTGYRYQAGNCATLDPLVPTDCAKVLLCIDDPVCSCEASGCSVMPGRIMSFDLTMGDTTAVGTVGYSSDTKPVTLTRVIANQ